MDTFQIPMLAYDEVNEKFYVFDIAASFDYDEINFEYVEAKEVKGDELDTIVNDILDSQ